MAADSGSVPHRRIHEPVLRVDDGVAGHCDGGRVVIHVPQRRGTHQNGSLHGACLKTVCMLLLVVMMSTKICRDWIFFSPSALLDSHGNRNDCATAIKTKPADGKQEQPCVSGYITAATTEICPGSITYPGDQHVTFSDMNDNRKRAVQYQPTTYPQPPASTIQPATDPQYLQSTTGGRRRHTARDPLPKQQQPPKRRRAIEPNNQREKTEEKTEEEEVSCVICFLPFTTENPPVCLPCCIADGTMSRHCVMCQPCLNNLLESHPIDTHISCPICRHPFNKAQVRKALEDHCLEFPAKGKSYVHHYDQWDKHEEDTVPRKRQCLEHLQNRVFDSKDIAKNLPNLCAKMRQHILSRRTWWNKMETDMLITAVDNLSFARITSPMDWVLKWGLLYKPSPIEDPFPWNLDFVVAHAFSLVEYYKNYDFSEHDVQSGSLALQSIIPLIDFYRWRFNQCTF